MPLNIPSIVFNKGNLEFGPECAKESYVNKADLVSKEEDVQASAMTTDPQRHENEGNEETSLVTSSNEAEEILQAKEESSTTVVIAPKDRSPASEEEKTFPLSWAWFCIKNYYTAPVNKFLFYMVNQLFHESRIETLRVSTELEGASDVNEYFFPDILHSVPWTLHTLPADRTKAGPPG